MASDIRVELANCQQVDQVWPIISEGLEKACRRTGGDLTSDYLWSEARAGRAFLAIVSRDREILAASVWRFEVWSTGRKLKCLCLYGRDMRAWLGQHRQFTTAMARAGGATAIVAEGRKGWARLFGEAKELRRTYEVELA